MKNCLSILCVISLASVVFSCKKSRPDTTDKTECYFNCPIDFSLIDYEPAWSPDNKYIAYYHVDRERAKNGIYLITPDGKENRLWHSGAGAETPSWSPDGQWIAFSYGAQIWKKKLNGDSLTQVTNAGRNFHPAWSPDGKWIAYSQSICNSIPCGIWITSTISNIPKFLVDYGNFPTWSSQKLNLLYQTKIVQTEGTVLGDSLWVYDLSSGQKRAITALTGNNYNNNYFNYSNTDKVTFTSQPQGGYPQIWKLNADGTSQKQLTQTGGYTSDWSPDGRSIVYTDSRAVNGRLWIMDADGSNKRQLTF